MFIMSYRKKEVDAATMAIVKEMTEAGSDVDESENEKKEEAQSNGAKESSDDNLVSQIPALLSQIHAVLSASSLCKTLF